MHYIVKMWSLLTLTYFTLTTLAVTEVTSKQTCPRTYQKIGCFDDTITNDHMLTNQRSKIDWENFHISTNKLACDCIEIAKERGYDYIQIGYYGECKGKEDFLKDYPSMTKSNKCVNIKYGECGDSSKHDCAGVQNVGYIYKIEGGYNRDGVDVNGGYDEWSAWNPCSRTCGIGVQARERQCTNPIPERKGKDCTELGPTTEERECILTECPVDGGFTQWSKFGTCTQPCGGGSQERTRSCTNPSPAHGGKDCTGDTEETQSCQTQSCPVNGQWSGFSEFSACSKSCGGGLQQQTRKCNSPAPAHGGKICVGSSKNERKCNVRECPVDGGFTQWSNYGMCSDSCGGGSQERTRSCTNPSPAHGGKDCAGAIEESQACNIQSCPVNGQWSGFSEFSACSKSCGGGLQQQTRKCNSPAPAHGGKTCVGSSKNERKCNIRECPVDGGFTQWSNYGRCSDSCGGGSQERTRSCTNPSPAHGGKGCAGLTVENRDCQTQKCPVDGGFTIWSKYGSCSKVCGGGVQTSRRWCTKPKPLFGGNPCVGKTRRWKSCNKHKCQVNGGWNTWTRFGACAQSCGASVQYRQRACTNPKPAYGGKSCVGEDEEERKCNNSPCPVDGGFTLWSNYGSCSKVCGGGMQKSTRSCTKPIPAYGGQACVGEFERTKPCNPHKCPVDGGFTQWSNYGACSDSCGGGSQERTRSCTNPSPAHGGKDCAGAKEESQACNIQSCPVNGQWSGFGAFSACSKSCGGGLQQQMRKCNSPAPANGGKTCIGSSKNERKCNTLECPVNGNWGSWGIFGKCSVTCGGGIQKGFRKCNNPPPAFNGENCAGSTVRLRACNTRLCPVIGTWGGWVPSGSCTKACGGGTQKYRRTCTNPTKQGIATCSGTAESLRACNTFQCRVVGTWGGWVPSGSCTKACGGGTQKYRRTCTNPTKQGIATCSGTAESLRACNTFQCRVVGTWGGWVPSGSCTKACGGGTQKYRRTCTNPAKQGIATCSGTAESLRACNTFQCRVPGTWTPWLPSSVCTRSCGGGTQVYRRTCYNPNKKTSCPGSSISIRACNTFRCASG